MNPIQLNVIANSFATIYKYFGCPNLERESCTNKCSDLCEVGPKKPFTEIAKKYIQEKKLESKGIDFESLPERLNRRILDVGINGIEKLCSKKQFNDLMSYFAE